MPGARVRCQPLTAGSVWQGRSEEPEDLVAALRGLSPDTCWVVLMLGGGHFAGAVFRG